MPVVQDTFFIPDDIAVGLSTGQLKRIGGVIRHAKGSDKGQIVKFLDPVTTSDNNTSNGLLKSVAKLVQEHKKLSVGSLVTVVGVGVFIYVKNREPKVVRTFRLSLRQYLDCVRNGNLDVTCIQNLLDALDALKRHKNYKKICVKLSGEELGELVNHVCEYTLKIAKENSMPILDEELHVPENQFDTVIERFQRCLETQKRIFDEAA